MVNMHSYMKLWLDARRALADQKYLESLVNKHDELALKVNSTLLSLKKEGHTMGVDLHSNYLTNVYIPNTNRLQDKKEKDFKAVVELNTIRLDHKITTQLIKMPRRKLRDIVSDDEHIDYIFAKLALDCKELINTARTLKIAEMHMGEILRNVIFSIKTDDNSIEYY